MSCSRCGNPISDADLCSCDDTGVELEAVHGWFELTYANYLVLPRTLLQSMPDEWQTRFVNCLRELSAAYDHIEQAPGYWVRARGDDGKFIRDPIPHYRRGRTRIPPKWNDRNRTTDGDECPKCGTPIYLECGCAERERTVRGVDA